MILFTTLLRAGSGVNHWLRTLVVVVLCSQLSACASLAYYGQAVAGQWRLWRSQQPINKLLEDNSLPAKTRAKLALVQQAREFAANTLALPHNGSYTQYVALPRPYVVWNVFAAPALSLTPEQSCFPLIGCVSYRGYFSESAANNYAAELRARGLDTYVGGVAAYSTLGWFNDPVLSSFLGWPEHDLVEILFHELAHQKLYVRNDTSFNESFATAVAGAGLEHFYAHSPEKLAAARQSNQLAAELTAMVLRTRQSLKAVYASDLSAADKHIQKSQLLKKLTDNYAALKHQRKLDTRFDHWMTQGWNNAKLASVATYHELQPEFERLLKKHQGEFASFYLEVARIAALEPARRRICLRAASETSSPDPCI